ncbi:ABC1 kinase family protein [Luteolibacter ambystomatis]
MVHPEDQDGGEEVGENKGTDLASDLERLGPAFVKIGQLLSTRADLLPPRILEPLCRLQDHVEPIPFEEVKQRIEEELGVRISKAFDQFDEKPTASASLGQVHRALLRDGREVAVKVQRPHIRKRIFEDLDSFESISAFLDEHTDFGRKYQTARIVEQFRSRLVGELDYTREADNLVELKHNLRDFDRLRVPDVIRDYTTSRVLTMEFLAGTKVTALSGAVLTDLRGETLAEQLFRAYLKQILIDGFFHADPHPGNLLLTPGREIAIMDLGMTGRVQARMRDHLMHLLAGISEGNGVQVAEAAMNIGISPSEGLDRNAFISRVEDIVGAAKSRRLEDINMGFIVMAVTKACADAGIGIPGEISLIGKTLMNLDSVGAALSPHFNPHEAIRRNLAELGNARMRDTLTSANFLGILTEVKDFVTQLPGRMNRILDLVSDNKLRVKVDSIDEKTLMVGLQKVANRITMGLILAAFIVGSSMLARIETTFRLFGYPGLAMVFFLVAAAGGILLLAQIYFKDR